MDKQLVFAVAGSGKTFKIIESAIGEKRHLILTYTNENIRSIEQALIVKHGRIPKHITVMSYFSFLYSFCFRPFGSYELKDKSYTWKRPIEGQVPRSPKKLGHYFTKNRYLYSNRLAKLLLTETVMTKIRARLAEFYDRVFIDEVQDFAANDFNFILELSKADVEMTFVGDFYQHTYDTSRDGQIRKNLHKKGIDEYLKNFKDIGFEIDTTSLENSRRCSPTVCSFITSVVGISITSNRTEESNVIIVTDPEQAKSLFFDDSKVKLFYENSNKYDCYSNNWGRSKGLNCYQDVCVVLNPGTQRKFNQGTLSSLAQSTRNKLYVACSRAFGDLYLIDEDHLKKFKAIKEI